MREAEVDVSERMSISAFSQAEGTQDWRVLGDGACAFFRTGSFVESARLVEAIAPLAEQHDRPPDVDVRAGGVTVRILTLTAEYAGLTTDDLELAKAISSIARAQGAEADPDELQSLLVIVGAPRPDDVLPFWRTVLGYEPRPDSPEEDLVDPAGRLTPIWLEGMQAARADGGGSIHLAIWVPPENAQTRIRSAIAAGGRVVRDTHAPAWVTLADPAGNECDVATVTGRDPV
jgi:4a-hydroxytetrahydrobiopterin dehydratase